MVKRAVGTKACLLGKAVTCNYLREDNFLEVYETLDLLQCFSSIYITLWTSFTEDLLYLAVLLRL